MPGVKWFLIGMIIAALAGLATIPGPVDIVGSASPMDGGGGDSVQTADTQARATPTVVPTDDGDEVTETEYTKPPTPAELTGPDQQAPGGPIDGYPDATDVRSLIANPDGLPDDGVTLPEQPFWAPRHRTEKIQVIFEKARVLNDSDIGAGEVDFKFVIERCLRPDTPTEHCLKVREYNMMDYDFTVCDGSYIGAYIFWEPLDPTRYWPNCGARQEEPIGLVAGERLGIHIEGKEEDYVSSDDYACAGREFTVEDDWGIDVSAIGDWGQRYTLRSADFLVPEPRTDNFHCSQLSNLEFEVDVLVRMYNPDMRIYKLEAHRPTLDDEDRRPFLCAIGYNIGSTVAWKLLLNVYYGAKDHAPDYQRVSGYVNPWRGGSYCVRLPYSREGKFIVELFDPLMERDHTNNRAEIDLWWIDAQIAAEGSFESSIDVGGLGEPRIETAPQ